jgi:hypothetical protein
LLGDFEYFAPDPGQFLAPMVHSDSVSHPGRKKVVDRPLILDRFWNGVDGPTVGHRRRTIVQ